MVAGGMDEDHRREDEARGDVGPALDTCMLQHRAASLMYLTMYRSAPQQFSTQTHSTITIFMYCVCMLVQ